MTRGELRKERRKFRVHDLVTWGRGELAHPVVEVRGRGLVVDASDAGFGTRFYVAFDGNARWGVHHQDGARADGTLRVVSRPAPDRKG